MAELVGVVSSAITFATLAVQVGKSVQTLKGYWDSMRDAPHDLKWLLREVEMFGLIMADVEADVSQNPVPLALTNSQHVSQSLLFCKEAVERLDALFRLLTLSQQCYARSLLRVQPDLIAEAIKHLEVVTSKTAASNFSAAPHGETLILAEKLVGVSKLGNDLARTRNGSCIWLLRAPYWMTSRVSEVSGMETSFGWDWSLRTYNEVRWSSEFHYYFTQGTVKDLQALFASGRLSPLFRSQGSGRSLLHYAICTDRKEDVVEFLLDQGVDPTIEGGFCTLKTPLRLLLEIGKRAASNKLYPLLPVLRPLLRHSQDLVYDNAQETVEGILSEFHGTSEEFMFCNNTAVPRFIKCHGGPE
ncbi:uncharacterized protein N7477_009514 [Penicillium maclennaniae]|uniref:uncharacterized protein n=1 Tax=Penicillium maclennaniae TaxID=1343394 RepID=UPI0025415470|nr:uncharacterized protein N7477_009514 [Penicillium maclennaniae]KAJ5661898.1 hypothetical protein N7477_009514 [Penicillium maclennaniae]